MEPNLISSFGQRDKTMRPENLHPQLIYDHVGFPSSSLMLVLTICSYLVINSSLVFHFPSSVARGQNKGTSTSDCFETDHLTV